MKFTWTTVLAFILVFVLAAACSAKPPVGGGGTNCLKGNSPNGPKICFSPTPTSTPTTTPTPSPTPTLPANGTFCLTTANSDWQTPGPGTHGDLIPTQGQYWNGYCVPFHRSNVAEWSQYGAANVPDSVMNVYFNIANGDNIMGGAAGETGCHGKQRGWGCWSMEYANFHVVNNQFDAGCTGFRNLPDQFFGELQNNLDITGFFTYGEDPNNDIFLHTQTPPPFTPPPTPSVANRMLKPGATCTVIGGGTATVNNQLENLNSAFTRQLLLAMLRGTLSNTTMYGGYINDVHWSYPYPSATATPYGCVDLNLGCTNIIFQDLSGCNTHRGGGPNYDNTIEQDPAGVLFGATNLQLATSCAPGIMAADLAFYPLMTHSDTSKIQFMSNGISNNLSDQSDGSTCDVTDEWPDNVPYQFAELAPFGFGVAGKTPQLPDPSLYAAIINCMSDVNAAGHGYVNGIDATAHQPITPSPTPTGTGTPGPTPTPFPSNDDLYWFPQTILGLDMLGWDTGHGGYANMVEERHYGTEKGVNGPNTIQFYPQMLFWFKGPIYTTTAFVPGTFPGANLGQQNASACNQGSHINTGVGGARAFLIHCGTDYKGQPAGVYRQEFTDCYFNHINYPGVDPNIDMGGCAVIANATNQSTLMTTYYPANFVQHYGHMIAVTWPDSYKGNKVFNIGGASVGNSWSGHEINWDDGQGNSGGGNGAVCGPATTPLPFGNPPTNCPTFAPTLVTLHAGEILILLQ